jgi:outer membrane lipase/esterase
MKKLLPLLCTFYCCIAVVGVAKAQSNGEIINEYIFQVCNDAINSDLPPDDELRQTCENALAPGAPPGPPAVGAVSVGAVGTSAKVSAYLKKRAIEEEESEKEGGGAGADAQFGNLSVFVNLSYLEGDRETTELESGFDISQIGLVIGSDYRFNNKLFAGAAFGFMRMENDLYEEAGNIDNDTVSLTGYSNYIIHENLSIDGYIGVSTLSYDATRRVIFRFIDDTATAQYDGRQFAIGAAGNYTYYFNAWSMSGSAKLDYISTMIDAYSESGGSGLNLRYEEQLIESFTGKLGAQTSYAWPHAWGVILPQARLHYVHEFANDSRSIETGMVLAPGTSVTLTTDKPDRDYFIGGVGASAVLPGGVQPFLDFEFLSGHDYLSTWTATVGLRGEI